MKIQLKKGLHIQRNPFQKYIRKQLFILMMMYHPSIRFYFFNA